jgi:hypothetical protein
VDSDDRRGTVGQPLRAPPGLEDADRLSQHAARGGGPKGHDRGGPDKRALVLEPPPTALYFTDIRPLVQASLAPQLVLEMFHRVGDEDVLGGKADGLCWVLRWVSLFLCSGILCSGKDTCDFQHAGDGRNPNEYWHDTFLCTQCLVVIRTWRYDIGSVH